MHVTGRLRHHESELPHRVPARHGARAVLKQCGDDLSRDNIIKQAKSLKELVLATALPGVRINTSAT